MWTKIITFILKIYFFLTPKDKSEFINYHVLSQDEFNKVGDNFILKEVIYSEHVETISGLNNRIPTTNHQILRKPYFLCATRKSHYIRDLKKKAYIGTKNFPLFDEIKLENDELSNQIIAYRQELKLKEKNLSAKLSLLDFIKNELNENTYSKLVFKYEQMVSHRSK